MKQKQRHFWRCAALTLLVSLLTAATAWADTYPEYVTDIAVVGGTDSEAKTAAKYYENLGYTTIYSDLNANAGGNYIYLCYKTGSRASTDGGYITDLRVHVGSTYSEEMTFDGITYYLAPRRGGSWFTNDVKGDLNAGCGSGTADIHLYYTRNNFTDKRVVNSVWITNGAGTSSGAVSGVDLNQGCGPKSDYIYIHMSTTTKVNRPEYDPVFKTNLVYNGGAQSLLSNNPTNNCTMYYCVDSKSGSFVSSTSSVTATTAGTHTVYYYAGANGYGNRYPSSNSSAFSQTVNIAKSPNSNASVSVNVSSKNIYGYESILSKLSVANNLSTGSVTWLFSESANGTYSTTVPTTVNKTYYVKARIAGDNNCEEYTTGYATFYLLDWTGDGTSSNPYQINNIYDMNRIATRVNAGNSYSGKYFKLTTNLTYSGTNNYTAIGTYSNNFYGTFDGGGFTISGINISQASTNFQGLFGYIGGGAVVKDVNLTNSVILGYDYSGGIAACNVGTVSGCTVASTVQVQATSSSAYYHGGIVGFNTGTVSDCTGSAQLTCSSTGMHYGGIVGYNGGTVSNNFVIGATVPSVSYNGAIVGYNNSSGTLSNNYYYNCTVAGQSNATGKGCNGADVTSNNGAVSVHTLTLAQGVSTSTSASKTYNGTKYYAQGTTISLGGLSVNDNELGWYTVNGSKIEGSSFTMPAQNTTVSTAKETLYTITLGNGISVTTSATKTANGTNYYANGTTVELSYSGTIPEGYVFGGYKVNGEAIEGNTFTMPAGNVTVTAQLEDNRWGTFAGADGSADHPYIITTTAGLDLLAEKVNAGNDYANTYFQLGADITYDKTVENNYTAIGTGSSNQFMGSFDGQGKTISGINVSKADNSYQGLFGYIGDGAVVKNVNLANSVILVYDYCGGIAGYSNRGTVSGCTVASDVLVQATKNVAYYHGGIVGINYNGTVSGCTSSAQLTCSSLNQYYGGIVGRNYGTVSDNFVIGATVPSVTYYGAIVGYKDGGSLSNNYYYNCTVAGQSNATGIGCKGSDVTENNGALSVHTLTLAQGVSTSTSASKTYNGTNYYAQGTTVELGGLSVSDNELGWYTVNGSKIEGSSFTMPAQNTTVGTAKETLYTITLGNGISVTTSATKTANGTNYYAKGTTVELSYSGTIPEGYVFGGYKVNGEAIEGNTFTMPAGDVTVTATFEDVWGVTANADGSADHPYIITTTAGLDLLAEKVNAGNDYANTYFQLGADITYDKTVENNYTAIGNDDHPFKGAFDGNDKTISGINISQASTNYQGLFGCLGEGAVVKDVNLTNSVILSYDDSGGIAGWNVRGTVSGCTVASTVQVQATRSDAYYHGGIVGCNYGTVSDCTSSAQLTCSSTGKYYGGIVGGNYSDGTVSGNFVIGATVPSVTNYGAIVGYKSSGTLSNNYYYNCTVAGVSNATGMGCAGADITDNNGAVSVHTITLGEGLYVRTSATMSYNNTDYYAKGASVALGYRGEVSENCVPVYAVNGEAIVGNTFTMPAADVTISVTFAEKMPYIVDLTGSEPVSLFAGQSSGEIEIVFMGLMGYVSAVDLTTGKTFPYADYYMKMVSAGDGAETEAMNYAFCFDLNLDGVNDMMLQTTSDNAYTMSRISAGADKLTSDYTFLWTAFESVMSSQTFELAFGQSPTSGITFRFGEEFESEELDFLLPLDNNSENNETFLTSIMARFNQFAVDVVSAENSITYDVVLKDRTLWCDGDWNTLCLPFDVDLNDKDCPLYDATARTLESASLSDDGIHLVLNFGQPVKKLEAGVPYIIKWESSANNIVNPVFKNVAIDFDYNIFYSDDDRVQFRGNWEKRTFAEERQDILMLGAGNQLFWPDGTAPSVLGACRACFFLPEPGVCAAQIRSFELNFEGESETVITNLKPERDDDSCYTLDGRKVNQPGKGGITILRGKKVLNK